MTQIDPKAMSKIKKCLALANSDNPHEAAAAMRQAKALMDKHGVSASHITMSEIGEAATKSATMSRDKPAAWEMYLAGMVGKAFGCKMMVSHERYKNRAGHINKGEYIFVGLKQQAEVASYTASVLIRKCKKARADFVAELLAGYYSLRGGIKKRATRAGDSFAEGWVIQIAKLVADFANPPEIEKAINEHIESQVSGKEAEARKVDRKDMGEAERLAMYAGIQAAAGESLHRPMSKNGDALMIAG